MRDKYDVFGFVEKDCFQQLMNILRKLDSSKRLSKLDQVWLKGKGKEYSTDEILCTHHRLEADQFLKEYRRTSDIWQLVNASGHLRKCRSAAKANKLLSSIDDQKLKQAKLRSAVRTTHGGVMRDLKCYTEALQLAEEAHELMPRDFRPCTLLGALHMETGNTLLGHEWYAKAEERGAKADSIESDIRSILRGMPFENRKKIISELLHIDSAEYAWLRKAFPAAKHQRR